MVFSRFNWLVGGFFLIGIAMMMWGIHAQPPVAPQVPIEQQLKDRQVARVCNSQCERQQLSCKGGSMGECYRAAACRCECYLQQDPSNASSGQWRQCAQQNTAKAEAASAREHQSAIGQKSR
jgi:hypothetical protein